MNKPMLISIYLNPTIDMNSDSLVLISVCCSSVCIGYFFQAFVCWPVHFFIHELSNLSFIFHLSHNCCCRASFCGNYEYHCYGLWNDSFRQSHRSLPTAKRML